MMPVDTVPQPLQQIQSSTGNARPAPLLRIPSQRLLGNSKTLLIEHEGMQYTLRVTRLGKLILTK